MSIAIQCPGCKKGFDVPEELVGRRIRCTACRTEIEVRASSNGAGSNGAGNNGAGGPAKGNTTATAAAAAKPKPPAKPIRWDDEEDEDRPVRKKSKKGSSDSSGLIVAGAVGGGVLLIALIVGAVFLLGGDSKSGSTNTASNTTPTSSPPPTGNTGDTPGAPSGPGAGTSTPPGIGGPPGGFPKGPGGGYPGSGGFGGPPGGPPQGPGAGASVPPGIGGPPGGFPKGPGAGIGTPPGIGSPPGGAPGSGDMPYPPGGFPGGNPDDGAGAIVDPPGGAPNIPPGGIPGAPPGSIILPPQPGGNPPGPPVGGGGGISFPGIGNTGPGLPGGFFGDGKKKAKIESFFGAAFDSKNNQLIVFSPRPERGRVYGTLTLYAADNTFAPHKRLKTQYLATRAIVDPQGERLYTATARLDNSTASHQLAQQMLDHAAAAGDIAVYDLKTLRTGTVEDGTEVKPAATVPLYLPNRLIRGLVLSPDGKHLYVLGTLTVSGRPTKSTIQVINTETMKPERTKDLPEPAGELVAAADGKHLIVLELAGGGRSGAVRLLDATTLNSVRSYPVQGIPLDVTSTPDGLIAVTVVQPPQQGAPGGGPPRGPLPPNRPGVGGGAGFGGGGIGPGLPPTPPTGPGVGGGAGFGGGGIGPGLPPTPPAGGGLIGPGGPGDNYGGTTTYAPAFNAKILLISDKGIEELRLLAARAATSGYLKFSPDGKTLYVSSYRDVGFEVYELDAGEAKLKYGLRSAGGEKIGGHFLLSPDGKYIAFHNGVVLDADDLGAPAASGGLPGGPAPGGGFPGLPFPGAGGGANVPPNPAPGRGFPGLPFPGVGGGGQAPGNSGVVPPGLGGSPVPPGGPAPAPGPGVIPGVPPGIGPAPGGGAAPGPGVIPGVPPGVGPGATPGVPPGVGGGAPPSPPPIPPAPPPGANR